MNNKVKNVVVTILFMAFIFIVPIVNILVDDKEVSKSERRELSSFSSINLNNFTEKFENYSLDQFVGRDSLRQVKAYITYNIFNQKDNNDIYIVNGQVSKYTNSLDEKSVINIAKKYNKLYNQLLSNMNVYYSIIPDKNYFIAKANGYPSIDYNKLVELMKNNMNKNIKYIDLFDEVKIDDYYKTDIHWRQENLDNVVSKLSKEMNFKIVSSLTKNTLPGFHGNYYGQSALPIGAENLVYCTNNIIDNAKVHILNEKTLENLLKEMSLEDISKEKSLVFEEADMYNLEAYNGIDPYDIYLSGAKSLIVIENDNATTDKELIIFRDSFGSSLSPLLLEGYKKITLIDLRYIANGLLSSLVDFKDNQDVLIINYTDILNNSSIIKVF